MELPDIYDVLYIVLCIGTIISFIIFETTKWSTRERKLWLLRVISIFSTLLGLIMIYLRNPTMYKIGALVISSGIALYLSTRKEGITKGERLPHIIGHSIALGILGLYTGNYMYSKRFKKCNLKKNVYRRLK